MLLTHPTPVRRVWFLDERGARPMDVWSYARFHAVHVVQPWCQRANGEHDAVFGPVHAIGQVGFAPYAGTDDVYLDRAWGGRRAVGERVGVAADGAIQVRQHLWIS